MLRDNLVGLIASMQSSGTQSHRDGSSHLGNRRPVGADSSLTGRTSFPFQTEPRQFSNEVEGCYNEVLATGLVIASTAAMLPVGSEAPFACGLRSVGLPMESAVSMCETPRTLDEFLAPVTRRRTPIKAYQNRDARKLYVEILQNDIQSVIHGNGAMCRTRKACSPHWTTEDESGWSLLDDPEEFRL